MKIDQKQIVDGYVFQDATLASKARKEAEGVQYVKEHLNMNQPDEVLAMYNRLRIERTFETAVGYAFLRELQEYLVTIPYIKNEEIAPLDITSLIETSNLQDQQQMKQREKRVRKQNADQFKASKRRIQIQRKEKRIEARGIDYKNRFTVSLIVNILLGVAIAAMFYISSTSDSMTIINYENRLINKYEDWEQELDKREQKIEEYEQKYNIQP